MNDPTPVDSKQEVRQLRREIRRDERRSPEEPVHSASEVAAPTGAGAGGVVAEADEGGIGLDPDELAAVEAELGARSEEIAVYLAQAEELAGDLGDGKGPVAGHMRRAFGLRAGEDPGGVRAALRQYLGELDGLREAIARVGAGHAATDEDVADAVRAEQSGGGGDVA